MKHPLRKHPGLLVPRALLLLSTPLAAAHLPAVPRLDQQPDPPPVEAAWQRGGWEFSACGGVVTTANRDVHDS